MNIRCTRDDIEAFKREEDGEEYCGVWKVNVGDQSYVLKKAKGYESEIYSSFFSDGACSVPRLVATAFTDNSTYILTEYIDGYNMCHCDRVSLVKVLDSLICLQDRFWNDTERADTAFSFKKSLEHRTKRIDYLNDNELEKAYSEFLNTYQLLPRTLCHDDLLPFNVLVSDRKAVLIDWETAGILPYPVSIARLIAHCEDSDDAFFYMRDDDKQFAIDYYYDSLIRSKGIDYDDYIHALNLFIFYEYCEWIMLGVKYDDADMNRYQKYLIRQKDY